MAMAIGLGPMRSAGRRGAAPVMQRTFHKGVVPVGIKLWAPAPCPRFELRLRRQTLAKLQPKRRIGCLHAVAHREENLQGRQRLFELQAAVNAFVCILRITVEADFHAVEPGGDEFLSESLRHDVDCRDNVREGTRVLLDVSDLIGEAFIKKWLAEAVQVNFLHLTVMRTLVHDPLKQSEVHKPCGALHLIHGTHGTSGRTMVRVFYVDSPRKALVVKSSVPAVFKNSAWERCRQPACQRCTHIKT